MSKRCWCVILLVVIGRSVHAEDAATIRAESPPTVHDIGSRSELFVDDALVERLVGKAGFRLQHPTPREVVMVHDAPWEGNNTTYHCVFQDGDRYRKFYVTGHMAEKNNQLDSLDLVKVISECLCENNNVKNFSRDWKGDNKLVTYKYAVIERSIFRDIHDRAPQLNPNSLLQRP